MLFVRMGGPTLMENCLPVAGDGDGDGIADTGERQIDHLFRPVDQSIALTLCGNGQIGTGDGWPGHRRGADEVSGR